MPTNLKVTLVCVGRSRGPVALAIAAYEGRLRHYFRFDAIEVKETPFRGQPVVQVQSEESERLLARVPDYAELIALHRQGKPWSSEDLASHLASAQQRSTDGVTLVIGGAYGLAPSLISRADQLLSLSAMTFPHEVARLVLAEQLYRAGTILRGEPYHKGSGTPLDGAPS